jgi:hypothetical protein
MIQFFRLVEKNNGEISLPDVNRLEVGIHDLEEVILRLISIQKFKSQF